MDVEAAAMLRAVAQELQISEEELLRQGLRSYLEEQLRATRAELLILYGRYGVRSVEAMESRYRDGTLEEADSWRDLQRMDHLEYRRDRLQRLIEPLE